MELQRFIQVLSDTVAAKASVNTVYGEPVVVGEKKVIPVARVGCGFGGGGGGGSKPQQGNGAPQMAGEGGGGGGFGAVPVGVVEITPTATRFIRFGGTRRLVGAFVFGILLGAVSGRRKLRG